MVRNPIKQTTAYWWKARHNFGDSLTPLLLEKFADIEATYAFTEDADIVVVGSVLEALPRMWSGVVAGAGKMYGSTRPHVEAATVLGLRGSLSAHGIGGNFAIGDPALLVDELVPAQEKQYNLGVVPHWSDTQLVDRFKQYNPRVIHPGWDSLHVISEIARCKKIVASSLHGIIVADAFAIPRRAEMFAQAHREGGDFKFRDYSSAINLPIEFGKVQTPDRWRIEELQRGLFDMFTRVGEAA